jgi:hypothetical protein
MAYRQIPSTFTVHTTNTPQPLFGSWVTAGAGFTVPAGMPLVLTLGTALTAGNDASMFVIGEPVWLIDPPASTPHYAETARISAISGNTVTLGNQTDMSAQGGPNPVTRYPHYVGALGTGTFIMPKQMANSYTVDFEDGGTGTFLYVGNSPLMTASAYRIAKLAKTTAGTQPQLYSPTMYGPGNPFDIAELWAFGTAADIYNLTVEID